MENIKIEKNTRMIGVAKDVHQSTKDYCKKNSMEIKEFTEYALRHAMEMTLKKIERFASTDK